MVDGFGGVVLVLRKRNHLKSYVEIYVVLACVVLNGQRLFVIGFQCCTTRLLALTHTFAFTELRRRESFTGRPRVFTPFGVRYSC
jgi:hypothetical protein